MHAFKDFYQKLVYFPRQINWLPNSSPDRPKAIPMYIKII